MCNVGSILDIFFTEETILAEPLPQDLDETIKSKMLENRRQILSLVQQKVDEVLNPSLSTYMIRH